jgi:hypothetical protein
VREHLFLLLIVWCSIITARDAVAQGDARVRPPAAVTCARDRYSLTSFTGVVAHFARESDRTTLQIRTDWDTTEDIVLTHKGTDPGRWFLFRGNPFVEADWKRIADADGHILKGTRATAWVCSDGSNPIVDWDAPKE